MSYDEELRACHRLCDLADDLMAHSTPQQLAECARLLSLHVAHYESQYGPIQFSEFLQKLKENRLNSEQLKLATSGMQTLVGMLGFIHCENKDSASQSRPAAV